MDEELEMLAGNHEQLLIGYADLVTVAGEEQAQGVVAAMVKRGLKPKKAGFLNRTPFKSLGTRFVGITRTAALAAAGTSTVVVSATQPFNAERFVMSRSVTPNLIITAWFIGERTILWSPGATAPIQCEIFAPDSICNDVQLDTIDTTRTMTITFQNTHASAAQEVAGTFVGTGALT